MKASSVAAATVPTLVLVSAAAAAAAVVSPLVVAARPAHGIGRRLHVGRGRCHGVDHALDRSLEPIGESVHGGLPLGYRFGLEAILIGGEARGFRPSAA